MMEPIKSAARFAPATLAFALAACLGTTGIGSSSSTGEPASSSAGPGSSTGIANGTSTGTSAGSSTGPSSQTSAGGAGTTTGSGILTPGPPCGAGRNWFGDVCAAVDCAQVPQGSSCASVPDGGFGICEGHGCVRGSLDTDPSNCGAFGVQCPAGSGCLAKSIGGCVVNGVDPIVCTSSTCPVGWTCLDYVGCVQNTCTTEGSACLFDGGAKVVSASQLGGCCGGSCLDLGSEPANCGNCGLACSGGQACIGGVCADLVKCESSGNGLPCTPDGGGVGACCLGGCFDLQSDPSNCGACSQACGSGGHCSEGRCVGTPQCPPGSAFNSSVQVCIPIRCARSSQGTSCAELDAGLDRQLCCNGNCVDVQTDDPGNCGGCGLVCPPGSICDKGHCAQSADCTSTFSSSFGFAACLIPGSFYGGYCCGGSCAPTLSDDQNCAVCGLACPAGSSCLNARCHSDAGTSVGCSAGSCPAGTACTSSGCLPTVCQPLMFMQDCAVDGGRGTCCGDLCVDNRSDPSNCAVCGASCPEGAVCSQGLCSLKCADAGCSPGSVCGNVLSPAFPNCVPLECTGLVDGHICGFGEGSPLAVGALGRASVCCGGACVDNFQDPQNCGACGVICPSGLCQNGSCVLSAPSPDCQVSCGTGSVCAYGVCVDSLCQSGGSECLAQSGNVGLCCGGGVCADLQSDVANCGQCGVSCPAGQSCARGTCSGSPECGPGHVGQLCNSQGGPSFECCPGAGCIDTRFDADNCGGCGRFCGTGNCDAGVCR